MFDFFVKLIVLNCHCVTQHRLVIDYSAVAIMNAQIIPTEYQVVYMVITRFSITGNSLKVYVTIRAENGQEIKNADEFVRFEKE
ncbi:hypothetical protein KIN20_028761 [Parelaphostrongylus tenuis]|uniref:Uncharacterized protein n=1 Tax=Parelaphostrongylus tenuis TaxID=148309 RepID=A0AAD5R1A5_PARTN|nr:hypothetical protein KIN20_028761 [Parelaphostrongylus tenuis]